MREATNVCVFLDTQAKTVMVSYELHLSLQLSVTHLSR